LQFWFVSVVPTQVDLSYFKRIYYLTSCRAFIYMLLIIHESILTLLNTCFSINITAGDLCSPLENLCFPSHLTLSEYWKLILPNNLNTP
jgi:hypothetical protein